MEDTESIQSIPLIIGTLIKGDFLFNGTFQGLFTYKIHMPREIPFANRDGLDSSILLI
jgi:hypothetical protein